MPSDIDADGAVSTYQEWLASGKVSPYAIPLTLPMTVEGQRALHDHLHARRKLILANLDQLRGHDLCCWCKPGEPCHADVLLRLANGGEG